MKRKFDEIDDHKEENASRKKQKQENQISSSLFENEKDKIRLQEIYELLQESELLKGMNISSDINKDFDDH